MQTHFYYDATVDNNCDCILASGDMSQIIKVKEIERTVPHTLIREICAMQNWHKSLNTPITTRSKLNSQIISNIIWLSVLVDISNFNLLSGGRVIQVKSIHRGHVSLHNLYSMLPSNQCMRLFPSIFILILISDISSKYCGYLRPD